MAKAANSDAQLKLDEEQIKLQFIAARALLTQYNTIHDYHKVQLQYYTVACAQSALGGDIEIDFDTKTVKYNIYTKINFKRGEKGIDTAPRATYSIYKAINRLKFNEKEERRQIIVNLTTWTRKLMWPETKVQIVIDGKQ